MKKFFAVGQHDSSEIKDMHRPILLAYAANKKLHLLNFEILESGPRPVIEWDADRHEMIMRFNVREGEFLAVGEKTGIARKEVLDESNPRLQGIKLSPR